MTTDQVLRRSFPLRLAKSLKEAASALARRDGISLNHFISLAVAEKISRLEHEDAVLKAQVRPILRSKVK